MAPRKEGQSHPAPRQSAGCFSPRWKRNRPRTQPGSMSLRQIRRMPEPDPPARQPSDLDESGQPHERERNGGEEIGQHLAVLLRTAQTMHGRNESLAHARNRGGRETQKLNIPKWVVNQRHPCDELLLARCGRSGKEKGRGQDRASRSQKNGPKMNFSQGLCGSTGGPPMAARNEPSPRTAHDVQTKPL